MFIISFMFVYFKISFRWYLPFKFKNFDQYAIFNQALTNNLQGSTQKIPKRSKTLIQKTNNSIINENMSVRRVQSYSPNTRSANGINGNQKLGENLMDIRSIVLPTDTAKQSYVDLQNASKKAIEWLESAKEHITLLRKNSLSNTIRCITKHQRIDDVAVP
jgi:hypothetical protein